MRLMIGMVLVALAGGCYDSHVDPFHPDVPLGGWLVVDDANGPKLYLRKAKGQSLDEDTPWSEPIAFEEEDGGYWLSGEAEGVARIPLSVGDGATIFEMAPEHIVLWKADDEGELRSFVPSLDRLEIAPAGASDCACPYPPLQDTLYLRPGATCPLPPGLAKRLVREGDEWVLSSEPGRAWDVEVHVKRHATDVEQEECLSTTTPYPGPDGSRRVPEFRDVETTLGGHQVVERVEDELWIVGTDGVVAVGVDGLNEGRFVPPMPKIGATAALVIGRGALVLTESSTRCSAGEPVGPELLVVRQPDGRGGDFRAGCVGLAEFAVPEAGFGMLNHSDHVFVDAARDQTVRLVRVGRDFVFAPCQDAGPTCQEQGVSGRQASDQRTDDVPGQLGWEHVIAARNEAWLAGHDEANLVWFARMLFPGAQTNATEPEEPTEITMLRGPENGELRVFELGRAGRPILAVEAERTSQLFEVVFGRECGGSPASFCFKSLPAAPCEGAVTHLTADGREVFVAVDRQFLWRSGADSCLDLGSGGTQEIQAIQYNARSRHLVAVMKDAAGSLQLKLAEVNDGV